MRWISLGPACGAAAAVDVVCAVVGADVEAAWVYSEFVGTLVCTWGGMAAMKY